MPIIATIIQHSFGSLTTPVKKKRKRSKRDPNWKRRIKTVSFADDMILYIENPKDATIKLLELVINLVKLQDTKSKHIYLLHHYTLIAKDQKEKLRKQSHLPMQHT